MTMRKTKMFTLGLLMGALTSGLGVGIAYGQGLAVSARASEDNIRRLNQLNEENRPSQEGDVIVADPLQRRELPPAGGPTVLLKSVSFSPNSVFISPAELDAIAAKYRGQDVDFSKISELVRDVNDIYAVKGVITAAAVLPPQQLADGNLQIRLVEGRLGSAAIVGEHQTTNEFIFDRVTLSKDGIVDVPAASQDIRYFNETNRAQLRLLLQPGAAFGFTDLLLGITEPPEHEFQFFLDNEGVSSTGEIQASLNYRNYGLAGADDTFMAFMNLSEGSAAGTIRYEAPINRFGTRVAVSGTASNVEIIDGAATILDITGMSRSASLTLTQALTVTERWSVFADLSAFKGNSRTWSASVPIVNTDTIKLAPGFTVVYNGDRGTSRGQIQAVFADSTNNIFDFERDINLITGSFYGDYTLGSNRSLVASAAFQSTDQQLLPGDLLFQIGGPLTVRGYPSDGIAGDKGYYGSLEFHQKNFLNTSFLDGYVFTDLGAVYSTFPEKTTLASVGAGVNYDFKNNNRFEMTAAFPLLDSLNNQSSFVFYAGLTFKGL